MSAVDTPDPAHTAVLAHLEAIGAQFEVMPCDPALADTAAFCAAYGYAPDDSANTILVVGKGGAGDGRVAACVVLATTRLDVNRTVRQRLGARKASFADPGQTEAATGMTLGGVTAFGLPDGMPLWVDEAVMARARIVVGGGSRSWKVLCAPGELLKVNGAEVVPGLAQPIGS
jgi:prolyl-tRNA editing enzyme YbaK/EbsC (Cys-tRNA(Pro) deacylase)